MSSVAQLVFCLHYSPFLSRRAVPVGARFRRRNRDRNRSLRRGVEHVKRVQPE